MGNGFEVTITPEEYFRLGNGRVLKNLFELMNALESMDEATFGSHVNESKNDFGNWVRDIFREEKLANSIFESKTREQMIKAIEKSVFEENKNAKESNHKSEKPSIAKVYKKIIEKQRPSKAQSQKPAQEPYVGEQNKIDEILSKEREIEKREGKIQEIEARIEKELSELAAKKQHGVEQKKFFSVEFVQGLLIGLLIASIGGLVYVKFFA